MQGQSHLRVTLNTGSIERVKELLTTLVPRQPLQRFPTLDVDLI
jgi:hypothetical protein